MLAEAPQPLALPMPWSSVKGVLFDVDGTLTHSDDLHFKAFVDLLQKPEWEINGAFHPSNPCSPTQCPGQAWFEKCVYERRNEYRNKPIPSPTVT